MIGREEPLLSWISLFQGYVYCSKQNPHDPANIKRKISLGPHYIQRLIVVVHTVPRVTGSADQNIRTVSNIDNISRHNGSPSNYFNIYGRILLTNLILYGKSFYSFKRFIIILVSLYVFTRLRDGLYFKIKSPCNFISNYVVKSSLMFYLEKYAHYIIYKMNYIIREKNRT